MPEPVSDELNNSMFLLRDSKPGDFVVKRRQINGDSYVDIVLRPVAGSVLSFDANLRPSIEPLADLAGYQAIVSVPNDATRLILDGTYLRNGSRVYVVDTLKYWDVVDATELPGSAAFIEILTSASLAAAAASAATATTQAGIATAQAVLADADRVQTNADRVQTGLDAAATAADRVQTGLDRVAAAASQVTASAAAVTATGQADIATAQGTLASDRASAAEVSRLAAAASASTATTQGGVSTTQAGIATTKASEASDSAGTAAAQALLAIDAAAEAAADSITATTQAGIATAQAVLADADRVQTNADRAQTGLDAAATAADRLATGLDVIAAEADRVATAADRAQTDLDRIQTGSDRTAAANSAASAASSATTALNALALQYKGGIAGASVPATAPLAGDYYKITADGTSHGKTWVIGDQAIYNGSSGSWTQVTGYFADADAADLAATAALVEREGLRFYGTAGAVIGGGGIPAVGTGDFTILFNINQDAASSRWIIGGSGGAAFQLAVYHYGAGYLARTILGSPFQAYSNSIVPVGVNAVLGYVRSSGVGTFKVGASDDGSAADSNDYTSATNVFSGAYEGGSIVAGAARKLSRLLFFNYALTAAEIAALTRRGLVTLPEQRGGSMVALNTSAFSSAGYETFTGVSATGFSAVNSASDGLAWSAPSLTLTPGKRYAAIFTATLNSGVLPIVRLGVPGGINCSVNQAVFAGANRIELTVVVGASGASLIFNSSSNGDFVISNLSFIPLGTLFEQDSGQRHAGYTVGDTSGNKLDLILPASGVSIIDPAQRGTIRFTTTTSGNQQIGGTQVIIPTNARITSWVINSSGTPNVTLGNVSAGAQYRASAAVVSGDNEITLLTRFTSTGNLWVNSSTTDTLKHTIQWEYIQ